MEDPKKSFFDEEEPTDSAPDPRDTDIGQDIPEEDIQATAEDGQADTEEQIRIPRAPSAPPPRRGGEDLATISLILGLAASFCCGCLGAPIAIAAIVTALLARGRMRRFNGTAVCGLFFGIFSLLLTVFALVLSFIFIDTIGDVLGGTESSLLFLPFWR